MSYHSVKLFSAKGLLSYKLVFSIGSYLGDEVTLMRFRLICSWLIEVIAAS